MAFSQGKSTAEAVAFEFSQYYGIGTFKVKAVNPDKKRLEELGYSPKEEPNYAVEREVNGTKIKGTRIELILAPDATIHPEVDTLFRVNFFLFDSYYANKDASKYQIIDEFGRTAWATKEEIKEKIIPVYANGPANITTNYRPAKIGEAELTSFLKVFLSIPDPMDYKNGTWVMKDNLDDCYARFEDLTELFKGNVKHIKDIINSLPDNKVRAIVTMRANNEGKMFSTVYSRLFLSPYSTNTSRFEKEVKDLANHQYTLEPLKEFKVGTTTVEKKEAAVDPFATADALSSSANDMPF